MCSSDLPVLALLLMTVLAWGAELLVCWGDTGDIPAVALLETGREPQVLLPGGASDAAMLAASLERLGLLQVEVMLMPTVSPFPKGAARLSAKCGVRSLLVLYHSRSRTPWAPLRKELVEKGTQVREIYPLANQYWRLTIRDWHVNYQRLKASGTFRISFFKASEALEAPVFYCEQQVTGVLAIGRQGAPAPILEIPKSNRPGLRKVLLE